LRVEREEALKLQNNHASDGQTHDVLLMASNPEFALARYRNLLNQMREIAAVTDHELISQRLKADGQLNEQEIWKNLSSSN
ncbi:MAG: hypothetical protein ACKO69_06690, partial [Limnohabitans sp.]